MRAGLHWERLVVEPRHHHSGGELTDSLKEPSQTQMPVIKGLAEVYNIIRDHHDALMNLKENPAEYTKAVDEELKKAMNGAYG